MNTDTSKKYTITESNAFLEEFELGPWRNGPLSGLKFAVGDFIDVEERATGCGNPSWLSGKAPAACNAVCVDILLSSGAQCVGKTHADEFGFSLLGENSFYGTPLNPSAPDHVPGGPASGAASAVACKLVDFAIAVDSGAAVQVASSNCGLFGFRAGHGHVPTAGILPIAPSFDTIGVFAQSPENLKKVVEALCSTHVDPDGKFEFLILDEAWNLLEKELASKLRAKLDGIKDALGLSMKSCSLSDLKAQSAKDLHSWYQTYSELHYMENWSSFGSWVEDRKPELGAEAKANMYRARMIDRSESSKFYVLRQEMRTALIDFLKGDKILCIPATTDLAPRRGYIASAEDPGDYYPTTLSLCALAALAGLPALTLPLAPENGLPIGMTLIASRESVLVSILNRSCR